MRDDQQDRLRSSPQTLRSFWVTKALKSRVMKCSFLRASEGSLCIIMWYKSAKSDSDTQTWKSGQTPQAKLPQGDSCLLRSEWEHRQNSAWKVEFHSMARKRRSGDLCETSDITHWRLDLAALKLKAQCSVLHCLHWWRTLEDLQRSAGHIWSWRGIQGAQTVKG